MNLSKADQQINTGMKLRSTDMVLGGIAQGGNINLDLADGWTPLLVAIEQDDEGLVRELVRLGADVNRGNNQGLTPLMAAAREGRTDTVALLLDSGANRHARTPDGSTACDAAVQFGHSDTAKLLQASPRPVVPPGMAGRCAVFVEAERERLASDTPLDWNSHETFDRLITQVEVCHAGNWKAMVDEAPHVNVVDPAYGRTMLVWAVIRGNHDAARYLLDKGADVDGADDSGNTPLIFAAMDGKEMLARLFLEAGADPDAAGTYGKTALMFAAARGYKRLAEMLLAAGADPAKKNHNGITACDYAMSEGHPEIVHLLMRV